MLLRTNGIRYQKNIEQNFAFVFLNFFMGNACHAFFHKSCMKNFLIENNFDETLILCNKKCHTFGLFEIWTLKNNFEIYSNGKSAGHTISLYAIGTSNLFSKDSIMKEYGKHFVVGMKTRVQATNIRAISKSSLRSVLMNRIFAIIDKSVVPVCLNKSIGVAYFLIGW